jgi:hypothetical protein
MALLALSPAVAPGRALAVPIEVGVGPAAVEEGDDRLRPAASLYASVMEAWVGRLYFYGREYGPVREETYLVTAARKFPIFKSPFFFVTAGLTLMDERTVIAYDKDADKHANENDDQYNVGAALGMGVSVPKGPLHLAATWESHVFPAGVEGGIFLSSGRKQMLAVTVGVALR